MAHVTLLQSLKMSGEQGESYISFEDVTLFRSSDE